MLQRTTTWLRDPRAYQIAVLASLLGYGVSVLDFEIRAEVAFAIAVCALGAQAAIAAATGARLEQRSALISTLSLCLLLRTTSIEIAAFAAFVAIGSKFALRANGKHIFNPTAFGLAVTMLLFDAAWVSGGQWGTAPIAALWIAGLGSLVVRRAERSDVTWAFLGSYLALLFGRALWLGDPLTIPLHAVSNGAFLIFAFFMISDPRTTPNSRVGRVAFAALVAAFAMTLRFGFYGTNALLWSLVICAPLVPWIDRLSSGDRYRWTQSTDGGHRDEQEHNHPGVLPGLGSAA
jgi:Na+-transporting NADH:ubiquinone oxidoreductase subunit NqrB